MAGFFSLSFLTEGRLLQLQICWRLKGHLQCLDNVSCDILCLSRAQERDIRPGTDTMKTLEKRIFFDVLQSSYTGHLKAIIHRGKDSLCLHSCDETYSLWKGFPVLWQGGKIWDCWCCQECSSQNSCCLGSFSLDRRRPYCGLSVYKGAL